MKPLGRVLILFFSLSLILLFPSLIEARSGCCSSHGGVCCECGPQANGRVICNDGWRGSSCSYAGMVKCRGSVQTEPVVYPTNTPFVIPTVIPTVKPTEVPTNTLVPADEPTKVPIDVPNEIHQNEEPKVKGETTSTLTTAETITALSMLSGMGYGGYKLVKKLFIS